MIAKVSKKTSDFVQEMFTNDFEPPRLGRGPGSDDYAVLYRDWLAKLDQDFRHYSDDEVSRAADVLRRTRETRTFPMPSIILDALKAARKELDNEKPKLKLAQPQAKATPESRKRAAIELMRGQSLVNEACEKGWIGPLWDWVLKHQALPTGAAVEIVKEDARETLRWSKRQAEYARKMAESKPQNRHAVPAWRPLGDPHEAAEYAMRAVETLQERTKCLSDFFLHGVESDFFGLTIEGDKP